MTCWNRALLLGAYCLGRPPSGVVDASSVRDWLPGFGTSWDLGVSIPTTVGGLVGFVISPSASDPDRVDAPLGSTAIQVGTSAPFSLSLTQYAPVLYSADGTGQGNVQAYHAFGTLVTPSAPASPGEVLLVYAMGLGPTTPPVPTGALSPDNPVAFIAAAPQVSVEGKPAAILFAGLEPDQLGIYQINFVIPADATTGSQNISLTIGGAASNTLTFCPSQMRRLSGVKQLQLHPTQLAELRHCPRLRFRHTRVETRQRQHSLADPLSSAYYPSGLGRRHREGTLTLRFFTTLRRAVGASCLRTRP